MTDHLVDPNEEDEWITNQRTHVREYLELQGVDHLGVGQYPAFHAHPYVALWAVQSKRSPGWIGWWAISGDIPTDHISSDQCRHPREALRAFAQRWFQTSEAMLNGEHTSGYSIGPRERWRELGGLLGRRAYLLRKIADDHSLWTDK